MNKTDQVTWTVASPSYKMIKIKACPLILDFLHANIISIDQIHVKDKCEIQNYIIVQGKDQSCNFIEHKLGG